MSKPFSIVDFVNSPDNYNLVINSCLIVPDVEIFDKETNKLVFRGNGVEIIEYAGSMDEKYADLFFKNVIEQAKATIIENVKKQMRQIAAKRAVAGAQPAVESQPLK
jgi:hypothetical protein